MAASTPLPLSLPWDDRREVRDEPITLPHLHFVWMADMTRVVDGVIIVRKRSAPHLADDAMLVMQVNRVGRHAAIEMQRQQRALIYRKLCTCDFGWPSGARACVP